MGIESVKTIKKILEEATKDKNPNVRCRAISALKEIAMIEIAAHENLA